MDEIIDTRFIFCDEVDTPQTLGMISARCKSVRSQGLTLCRYNL